MLDVQTAAANVVQRHSVHQDGGSLCPNTRAVNCEVQCGSQDAHLFAQHRENPANALMYTPSSAMITKNERIPPASTRSGDSKPPIYSCTQKTPPRQSVAKSSTTRPKSGCRQNSPPTHLWLGMTPERVGESQKQTGGVTIVG